MPKAKIVPTNLLRLYFERHFSSLFLRNSLDPKPDYYQLLGVNNTASFHTIDDAYSAGSSNANNEEEAAR